MPLSCKHGEKTVFSFDFDAAGWAGLKGVVSENGK
jgi:hypothetical protein